MNKIDDYISKQQSIQKEICQYLREIIFETFPDIQENMKWGVPAYADGLYYFVALKNHVNLGFTNKNLTEVDAALFDGGGKTTKHICITSLKEIDRERIVRLLKLVHERQL